MPRTNVILKILFTLCVWSFVIIGVFKMQGTNIVPQEYSSMPLSGRILLQKDMLRYVETTSTTTDRFDPSEILVDNRTGKYKYCSTVFFFFVFSFHYINHLMDKDFRTFKPAIDGWRNDLNQMS